MKEEKHIETQEEIVRIDGLLLPTDEDIKAILESAKGMLATYEEACLANAEMLIDKYENMTDRAMAFSKTEDGAGRHFIEIYDADDARYFLFTPEQEPDATYQLSVHHKEFLSMKYIYNMVEKLRTDINDLSAILGILPSKKATVRYYDLTQKK